MKNVLKRATRVTIIETDIKHRSIVHMKAFTTPTVYCRYMHQKIEQISNFKILIQSIIQVADLEDKNFSYKFCCLHILSISVIERTAFVWILLTPSNNQDKKILYTANCFQDFTLLQLPIKWNFKNEKFVQIAILNSGVCSRQLILHFW